MEWLQCVERSLRYIEEHLTEDIGVDDVCRQAFSSESHFPRVFNLVTGVTLGEYIRNRRLSKAGDDLLSSGERVIDVAMRYGYDTSESFSKAFARFHGISPSEARFRRALPRYFHPMRIQISIQGGFTMSRNFMDAFCWNDSKAVAAASPAERYRRLTSWAAKARGQNPNVFDELTAWILDDAEWTRERLTENEQLLRNGVLARFRRQNEELRQCLNELAPSGVVNAAVFGALDKFDEALAGHVQNPEIASVAARVFADFSLMLDRDTRRLFAGCQTGPTGTDSVEVFGYVNALKDCDAVVQWALFMPDYAQRQQKGFRVASFEYKRMPAMRFIGKDCDTLPDSYAPAALFEALDRLSAYSSGMDDDMLLTHFHGRGIDVEPWHGYWGRFFQADTPVPEGFLHIDFIPDNDNGVGEPYMSQFAHAVFEGDTEALHAREGYDGGAMYDVTRNIMLGQGVSIPYPVKYWTAELFPDGWQKPSCAYLFSAEL